MDPILFKPGFELFNSNGDIDAASMGYQYTIQTTTQIRGRVIKQKFYEVPPAQFIPISIGTGAWMEEIKTNRVYNAGASFEAGLIGNASSNGRLSQVSIGTDPVATKIHTFAMEYLYSIPEVQKALAANNWDVVEGKMSALKKLWDLGIQKVAFLGLKGDLTATPGLLTQPAVNSNLSAITENISGMDAADFQDLVATVLGLYFANSNNTAMPTDLVIPMADFLGLGSAASADFPMVSKLDYLLKFFRQATGNANFQIRGLAYAGQASNAGYIGAGGKNRYVLYRNDPDSLSMDIPVDFTLFPAGTQNNFQFNGVGAGQFSGCIVYRVPEMLYFDWAV